MLIIFFLNCINEICFELIAASNYWLILCNILICMQKQIQPNKDDQTQFFRKIYLLLYSKGLRKGYCVRGELKTEQRLQHIDTHSSGYSIISFPFSWAAQLGAWWGSYLLGPGFHSSDWNIWLQTLISNCSHFLSHPGYIIIWRPPASCCVTIRTQFSPSTVKVNTRYLRPDAPVIYTGAFLIWQLGQVVGLYVTVWYIHTGILFMRKLV